MTLAEWLDMQINPMPPEVLAEIEGLQAVAQFVTEPGDFHTVLTGYEAKLERAEAVIAVAAEVADYGMFPEWLRTKLRRALADWQEAQDG